ncbi:MAG: hypothetical protein MI747_11195, partial [Desulfobacterales bacterium]|nr:hypothetical protein [Desulfobacterales bacterium]
TGGKTDDCACGNGSGTVLGMGLIRGNCNGSGSNSSNGDGCDSKLAKHDRSSQLFICGVSLADE